MANSAYFIAWEMTQNIDLTMRVAAAVQQESEASAPIADPEAWAKLHRWEWATQVDWTSAVAAAQETGICAWGSSAGVITDYMILSYVQGALAPAVLGS